MKFLKNKIISSVFLFVFLVSCSSSELKDPGTTKDVVREDVIVNDADSSRDIEVSPEKPDLEEGELSPSEDSQDEKDSLPLEEAEEVKDTAKEKEVSESKEISQKEDTQVEEKKPVVDNSFFEDRVDSVLSGSGLDSAHYGIKVVNLTTGKTLFERNENSSFIPASNTKLYTGAAAMKILGKDYKFKTRLAYRGEITPEGVLNGDLYIIGGGDPTLGSKYLFNRRFNMNSKATPGRIAVQLEFLDAWSQEVKKLGISRINGSILVDDSHFDRINPAINTWEWMDISTDFGAPPSGAGILDNVTLISFGRDAKTQVTPATSTVEVINRTKNGNSNKVIVASPPYGDTIVAVGEVNTSASKEVPVPEPGLLLGDLFRKNLEKNGISTTKSVEMVDSSSGSSVFFTYYSPDLERISLLMNSYSINLYAEALKLESEKELAKRRPISISRYWYEILKLQGFRIYDGSGLSRYSRVTPNNTIDLLSYMYSSEYSEDYYNTLAVAGQRGTLEDFKSAPLRNNFHGKSGTLTGIKSYSGYMKNSKGDMLAFSMMINLHGLSNHQITKKLEVIMGEMYKLQ